jgi:hypothetical protein
MDAIVKYPNRWPPGVSGNPAGKPLGARSAFSAALVRDIAEVWAVEGKRCVEHTAKKNPEVYFATCARLIPKDVQLTIEQTTPRGLEPEDLAILRAIRDSIPNANSRSPQDVLTFVLQAVKAHGAHQVIEATSETETEVPNA